MEIDGDADDENSDFVANAAEQKVIREPPQVREAEILAGQYHSNIKPKAVLATVCAFEVRYDLPLVFVPTPQAGARLVERWAFYVCRETVENVNIGSHIVAPRSCCRDLEAAMRAGAFR